MILEFQSLLNNFNCCFCRLDLTLSTVRRQDSFQMNKTKHKSTNHSTNPISRRLFELDRFPSVWRISDTSRSQASFPYAVHSMHCLRCGPKFDNFAHFGLLPPITIRKPVCGDARDRSLAETRENSECAELQTQEYKYKYEFIEE